MARLLIVRLTEQDQQILTKALLIAFQNAKGNEKCQVAIVWV